MPTDRSGLLELHNSSISIREQCRLLDINRSGLYYKPIEPKQIQDSKFKLLNLVDETYTQHPFMGTRMMADYLQLKEH